MEDDVFCNGMYGVAFSVIMFERYCHPSLSMAVGSRTPLGYQNQMLTSPYKMAYLHIKYTHPTIYFKSSLRYLSNMMWKLYKWSLFVLSCLRNSDKGKCRYLFNTGTTSVALTTKDTSAITFVSNIFNLRFAESADKEPAN